jgi:protein phosphatase
MESKDELDFVKERDVTLKMLAQLGFAGVHKRGSVRVRSSITCEAAHRDPGETVCLNFPISFAEAELLRTTYSRHGVSRRLNYRVAAQILSQFTERYQALHPDPLVHVNAAPDGRVIVVGDTHGQLQDVLTLFHTLGPPSAKNIYLFNGDIADRGPNASEIFFLLFAYFLAEPMSVLINRGNHENEDMNAMESACGGGFMDEVLGKFDATIYNSFASAFRAMQLCTIVGSEVFVVHGGLWKGNLRLAQVRAIAHRDVTQPDAHPDNPNDQAFNDMLWSDPTEQSGEPEENPRGCGVLFGPNVTEKFLELNPPLSLVIRSHQLPARGKGYMMHHSDRCLTIFSASNYGGDTGNEGAVIIFEAKNFPDFFLHEFYSLPLERIVELVNTGGGEKTDWEAAGRAAKDKAACDEAAKRKELQKMMVCIVEKKSEIWDHVINSIDGATAVNYETWAGIMSKAVGAAWRWGMAWTAWRLGEQGGTLDFKVFLQRFTVNLSKAHYMTFKFQAISSVYERIMNAQPELQEKLRRADQNGDGMVDMQEMRDALASLDLEVSSAQLNALIHTLFAGVQQLGGIPVIPISDILGRFTVVYKRSEELMSVGANTAEQRLAQEAFSRIGQLLVATPIQALRRSSKGESVAVKTVASSSPGVSASKRWQKGVQKLKMVGRLTPGTSEVRAQPVCPNAASAVQMGPKLEAVFNLIDADQSGLLDIEEFVNGLWGVPGVSAIRLSTSGEALTKQRLQTLARMLEHSGGGISMLGFLEALCFEDAAGNGMADTLAEHMLTVLFRHRQSVRQAAHHFDTRGEGMITPNEFEKVLMALNETLAEVEPNSGPAFSESQVVHLCSAIAGDNNMAAYEDFFDSFEVVDRENPSMGVRLGRHLAHDT